MSHGMCTKYLSCKLFDLFICGVLAKYTIESGFSVLVLLLRSEGAKNHITFKSSQTLNAAAVVMQLGQCLMCFWLSRAEIKQCRLRRYMHIFLEKPFLSHSPSWWVGFVWNGREVQVPGFTLWAMEATPNLPWSCHNLLATMSNSLCMLLDSIYICMALFKVSCFQLCPCTNCLKRELNYVYWQDYIKTALTPPLLCLWKAICVNVPQTLSDYVRCESDGRPWLMW